MAPMTRQVAGPVQLRPVTALIRSLMERTAEVELRLPFALLLLYIVSQKMLQTPDVAWCLSVM